MTNSAEIIGSAPDTAAGSPAASPDPSVDDRKARRNAIVLAVAQALYGLHVSTLMTLGGIVGHLLADDKSWATLPVTTFVLGTAITTAPAALLMRVTGRRFGFMLGTVCGLGGAVLAAHAIFAADFVLFCIATALTGAYQAFAQYYRFAAADTASEQFAPKAISWVLLGGAVAAFLGPELVVATKDWFSPVLYAGSFLAVTLAAVAAMAILSFVDIPLPKHVDVGGRPPRPLGEILSQKRLLIAMACGMIAFAGMSLIMTASPLAMIACSHTVDDAAFAIQWHAISMYLPSFFTGALITRFGVERITMVGLILIAGCALVALSGESVAQFWLALVLLGIGWNFAFVGATTMVTQCHRRSERAKVQAINDFTVFSLVALASLSSGKLLHNFGWDAVNIALLPFVLFAFILIVILMVQGKRQPLAEN